MARIHLLAGPRRSDRARRVDDRLLERRGEAILLTPTRQQALARMEQLARGRGLRGVWGRPILAFEDFARALLQAEGRTVFPLSEFERRLLIEGELHRLEQDGKLAALQGAGTSRGFVTHVLRVITQLKQAAVNPDHFRAAIASRREASWLDAIVADVYDAYQTALQSASAYDHIGVYWEAEVTARAGKPSILEGVQSLLLDPFDDFTPSEFRLIEALAAHVEELVFGVPCSLADPGQNDLYRIPRDTVTQICGRFPDVELAEFPEEPPVSYSDFAGVHLFWRDQPACSDQLIPNIRIIPCVTLAHEIETIARHVKSLLIDEGVAPRRIAIVFRRLAEVEPALRSILAEFDVPANLRAAPTVDRSATGRFILKLLDAVDDWKADDVLDVVSSPWYGGDEPLSTLFTSLVYAAEIIDGREDWARRLDWLAQDLRDNPKSLPRALARMTEAAAAVEALRSRVALLGELDDAIPRRASVTGFVEAVQAALSRIGWPRVIAMLPEAAAREEERGACETAWNALDRMADWDGRAPRESIITRAEFAARLRDAFRDTPIAIEVDSDGVQCADATWARHESFEYVFFGGLNEGEMPLPPPVSAIYTERDLEELHHLGVPLEERGKHIHREMLLFQQIIGAASKGLVVTWRTTTDDSRPMSPSPFLTDLADLFPPEAVSLALPAPPAFVPELDRAASPRDLRNALCFESSESFRRAFADDLRPLEVGIAVETARNSFEPFGPYDGIIRDPQLREEIAAYFGPNYTFSAGQLEGFATCPFQFFIQRVLGVQETVRPDRDVDPQTRGTILHAALHAFHRQFAGRAVSDLGEVEARDTMRDALDEAFNAVKTYSHTPAGLLALERRRLDATLQRYLAIARDKDKEWRPVHFEVSFGFDRERSGDPLDRPEVYVLDTPAGPVRLRGRIDRVDENDEGHRIIDYKSSSLVEATEIKDGVALQLALYAMALEEFLLPGSACRQALFVRVGFEKRRDAFSEDGAARRELARAKVAEYLCRIRSGEFPPTPYKAQCALCKDHRPCRYEGPRIERKMGSAP